MKSNVLSENLSLSTRKMRILRRFGILPAALLVILLNGCASIGPSKDPDPYQYNPHTGYPFIGGPFDHARP